MTNAPAPPNSLLRVGIGKCKLGALWAVLQFLAMTELSVVDQFVEWNELNPAPAGSCSMLKKFDENKWKQLERYFGFDFVSFTSALLAGGEV